MPLNCNRDLEFAWLAGLLEGEGYFCKQTQSHSVYIALEMNDEDVVREAARIMQTTVRVRKHPNEKMKNGKQRKDSWRTKASGDCAVGIIKKILPFMGQRRKVRIEEMLLHASKRITFQEAGRRSALKTNQKRWGNRIQHPALFSEIYKVSGGDSCNQNYSPKMQH